MNTEEELLSTLVLLLNKLPNFRNELRASKVAFLAEHCYKIGIFCKWNPKKLDKKHLNEVSNALKNQSIRRVLNSAMSCMKYSMTGWEEVEHSIAKVLCKITSGFVLLEQISWKIPQKPWYMVDGFVGCVYNTVNRCKKIKEGPNSGVNFPSEEENFLIKAEHWWWTELYDLKPESQHLVCVHAEVH